MSIAVEPAQPTEEKEEKEAEPKENKVEAKKPAAASGANSMLLLKHQIELSNLKEQLEELKAANKELETELSSKNTEIYDVRNW